MHLPPLPFPYLKTAFLTPFVKALPLLLWGLLMAACGTPGKDEAEQKTTASPAVPSPSSTGGIRFEISTAPAHTGHTADNWCHGRFDQAQVFYPDPANANRRYFVVGAGMYRVAVDLGSTTASFLLRRRGDQVVEVFTSDQFPECLSNRSNLLAGAADNLLVYDNRRHLRFQVAAERVSGQVRCWLEIPAGSGYGLLAHQGTLVSQ